MSMHNGMDGMSMESDMSGMMMDIKRRPGGMVVNENTEDLPPGCSEISSNRSVYVEGGERYASPGEAYSFSTEEYDLKPCQRVTVEFSNRDEVRHQWMIHGLPEEVYAMGMFNIEVQGGETVEGTFITPSEPQKLNLHCSVPQHEQKGMHGSANIQDSSKPGDENPFWSLAMEMLGL